MAIRAGEVGFDEKLAAIIGTATDREGRLPRHDH